MTPILVLLVTLPAVEIRAVEVAMLETNTVVRADGTVQFIQVVAWSMGRDENNRPIVIDRGYKVVKEGYPAVHPYGDTFRGIHWVSTDRCIVVTAPEHLVRTTDHDPEAEFRAAGGAFRPAW